MNWFKALFIKGISFKWAWRFGGNNDRKENKNTKSNSPSTVTVIPVRDKQSWKDS